MPKLYVFIDITTFYLIHKASAEDLENSKIAQLFFVHDSDETCALRKHKPWLHVDASISIVVMIVFSVIFHAPLYIYIFTVKKLV